MSSSSDRLSVLLRSGVLLASHLVSDFDKKSKTVCLILPEAIIVLPFCSLV